MKKIFKIVPYIIITLFIGFTAVYAGNLTPPSSPTKTMKSLSDLYELVNTGTNTPSVDFNTPSSVSSTMNSIGETYDLMVAKISDITSVKNKILSGVTLFGVNGSMPDKSGSTDFTPSTSDFSIPEGYYDGTTKIIGDSNLLSSNIKSGLSIFGINGSLITNPLYGDNNPDKVLNTASNPGNFDPNTLSVSYNTSNLSVGAVKKGILFGNSLTGDYPSSLYPLPGDTGTTDATESSVIAGFESWSKDGNLITGSAIASVGDALSSNVLSGKYFSNSSSSNIAGTMPSKIGSSTVITPSNSDQTIAQGYYGGSSGDGKVLGDANLTPNNIKSGVSIFGVSGNLSAGTNYSLPKTDQTGCWGPTGISISCTATGQDGDLRKGFSGTRFTNNGDGTTTDNATGLIWQRQDNATQYSWSDALTYCKNNTAGLPGSGWRLPNIKELISIVNFQNVNPSIDTANFPSTKSGLYLSSTTYHDSYNDFVWDVSFADGNPDYTDKVPAMFGQYVRCVR